MNFILRGVLVVLAGGVSFFSAVVMAEDSVQELETRIQVAYKNKDLSKALKIATEAVSKFPGAASLCLARGQIQEDLRQYARAESDYSKAIELTPSSIGAYQRRGVVRFFQLKFEASLADFDRVIELAPAREPHHWQRGLVHYYAGKYEAGRRQFELHQTVNPRDVENAVWHFLCVARLQGVKEARDHFIKITGDRRVPLKEVHALFSGAGKEKEVLDAITAGNSSPQGLDRNRFYGHLYLGLYYEAVDDKKKAKDYMEKAAANYREHGYMGEVARVHAEWLRAGDKSKVREKK